MRAASFYASYCCEHGVSLRGVRARQLRQLALDAFRRAHGCTPRQWLEAWDAGDLADTGSNQRVYGQVLRFTGGEQHASERH